LTSSYDRQSCGKIYRHDGVILAQVIGSLEVLLTLMVPRPTACPSAARTLERNDTRHEITLENRSDLGALCASAEWACWAAGSSQSHKRACADHTCTQLHPAQRAANCTTLRTQPHPAQRAVIRTTRRIEPRSAQRADRITGTRTTRRTTGRPHHEHSYHTPHNGHLHDGDWHNGQWGSHLTNTSEKVCRPHSPAAQRLAR
jgi:hypothetical protein